MARPKDGYRIEGVRVPGVTTIVGRFKDSGGLIQWAYNCGRDGIDMNAARDGAASIGSYAHALVEAHIAKSNARPDPGGLTPEQLAKADQAFIAYLEWERHTRIKIVEQETPLVSLKHRFGGTFDAIGEIDGKLCLLDWKSSNKLYPEMLIQLAAYKGLWEEHHPDRPITGGFHLCRFAKDWPDFGHHYFADLDLAWKAFLHLRELYEIDKDLKKRAA